MGLLNTTAQSYYDDEYNYGNYQFVSLTSIINQFMLVYVGEDKIIPKAKRLDVAFHAQRALAELSFDTFKSCKAQEITVPASLQMILPQDYVNYTKISWVDSAGIKHLMYPTSKTSNPSSNPLQDSDGDFILQGVGSLNSNNTYFDLDGEYKDIVVGMTITGPYIPDGTLVGATSNSGGITRVYLQDSAGNDVYPTHSNAGTTLTFINTRNSLVLPQKSSFIVENLYWNTADYKIINSVGASELTDIKVGMIVSHDNFQIGTVVTNVYGNTIVVNQLPNTIVMPNNAQDVTFVSPDLKNTDTWSSYKSAAPSENQNQYDDDTYWPMDGSRFGLDPQHAQANGSFYVDCKSGKIHFSSNISGKTVILDYISDSLGTDREMQVHKFAEEAMYKWISYAILSGKANVPEYLVHRLKKERFAAIRTAKLRLSNLKLEELTQILRGKSKQIKH
jgi:hypothetical protein